MKTIMYTIWDSKAQVYNKPFYQLNDQIALRSARDLLTQDNDIARHPEDFTMFRIGEYDDQTAKLTVDDKQIVIARFHELIDSVQELPNEDNKLQEVG